MAAIGGRTMADLLVLIHPDDRTRLAATAASDVVQQLPTSRVEYRIQAGDGTYVWPKTGHGASSMLRAGSSERS